VGAADYGCWASFFARRRGVFSFLIYEKTNKKTLDLNVCNVCGLVVLGLGLVVLGLGG
jgi:hypothetical protein